MEAAIGPRPMADARVGQQGSLTYVWADKGSRPRAPRDQRHASAYLFGAVCPARGIGAALVLPGVNIEAMNPHLAEISTQIAVGAHAVVILDGAGWHRPGGDLDVPANISPLPLPPYSPEPCVAKNSPPDCFLDAPHRSRISGNIYARTISPTASSKPTTKQLMPAGSGMPSDRWRASPHHGTPSSPNLAQ